jgi:hypothetical protein
MSSFESPLKAKKKDDKKPLTREESNKIIAKMFKKPKAVMSLSTIKKIVASPMVDSVVAEWTMDYVRNLVQSESLPPQLYSNSFVPLLYRYFGAAKAEVILAKVRQAFQATFGTTVPPDNESHTNKSLSNTLIGTDDLLSESESDIDQAQAGAGSLTTLQS